MPNIQAPFKRPKHVNLLHEITKMMINIKLSYLLKGEAKEKAQSGLGEGELPTWEMVVTLLNECYDAIEQQKEEDFKKY